jgi:hypothetical protein
MAATGSASSVGCGAVSGAVSRCSGGCWPASPKVVLAGVAASGREHAIRVRGRATTVIPEAATPGAFPANLGPTEPPLGVAADGWSSYARIRPPLPPGGWPQVGPPSAPRASVPHPKGSSGLGGRGRCARTGRPGQEHRHPDHPGPKRRLPRSPPAGRGCAAKLLFEADGAGLMLVGKEEELLTWGQRLRRPGRAGRGREGGAGAGPLHGRLAAAEPGGGPGCGGRVTLEPGRPGAGGGPVAGGLECAGGAGRRPYRHLGGVCGWAARLDDARWPLRGAMPGGGQSWPGQSAPPSGTRPEGQRRSGVAVAAALRRSELR